MTKILNFALKLIKGVVGRVAHVNQPCHPQNLERALAWYKKG